MELSRQADYAVRAMVDIASFPSRQHVLTGEIAKRQNIPESILPHIIAALGKAGLVHAYRGKDGGVVLARPAMEISVLDVIEAIEGPIRLNRCTYQPSLCDRSSFCRVHHVWRQVQDYLNQKLEGTKLTDLVDKTPEVALPLLENSKGVVKDFTNSGGVE